MKTKILDYLLNFLIFIVCEIFVIGVIRKCAEKCFFPETANMYYVMFAFSVPFCHGIGAKTKDARSLYNDNIKELYKKYRIKNIHHRVREFFDKSRAPFRELYFTSKRAKIHKNRLYIRHYRIMHSHRLQLLNMDIINAHHHIQHHRHTQSQIHNHVHRHSHLHKKHH